MFFIREEGRNTRNISMKLDRGKPECRTDEVYITVSYMRARQIKLLQKKNDLFENVGKYSRQTNTVRSRNEI